MLNFNTHRRRCRLKRYSLQVRHKQDWGPGFILLLPQASVLPESDMLLSMLLSQHNKNRHPKPSDLVLHVVPDV